MLALLSFLAASIASPMSDDAAVLQASMLEFATDQSWNKRYCKKGEMVALSPVWGTTRRWKFLNVLEDAIPGGHPITTSADPHPDGVGQLKVLHTILRNLKSSRPGPAHGAVISLSTLVLSLDPRIVVTKLNRSRAESRTARLVRDRYGKARPLRIYCSASAPSYSSNGRYACLSVSSPSGPSGFDNEFGVYLEKTAKGWKVLTVLTGFSL